MKLNLITTKEILDFENEIGYELVVNERAIHVGSPTRLSKYYVQFEKAEVMEAKKLRIGNLVGIQETALHADGCNYLEAIFEIEELKKDVAQFKGYHSGEYYKDLKGVKINEGLLSLYGFKRSNERLIYLPVPEIKSEIHYEKHNYGNVIVLYNDFGSFIPNDIEYLHELQNLFFAITGTELELKHERSTCT